ncbi:MFS transporter [Bombilactobacillus bombi]|uniref:MFS transporter n=1 Tax=Bombilactobacillus bombi TaxID=1303590 RepID=A0A3R6VKK1_9LACO|nr:MFS transporter [Bombilactobacillus bombi]RHW51281.1 MFS transporter [Bombilactobacillus bombi]
MTTKKKITARVLTAVIAAGIMSFCGVIVETAMNITFPTLMKEFDVDTTTVQWMTTGCLLVVAIVVPLSAILKKNFPTKAIFLAANLLFILGAIIDALAPTFILLLIGRMIQGVGTGLALPLMFNIILEQVPAEKIGLMMGIGSLITAIAPAIGPTYGGLVVNSLGWRYIFILLLPILIVSLFLGWFSITQVSAIHKTPIDWLSIVSIILLFTGLILGFSNLGTAAIVSWQVLGAWIIGILSLFLLLYRNRVATPILNLGVLNNSRFTGHVISFFFFQLCGLGISFILPNYIQLVNHQSATIAGLVVLPGAALGAILAPFGGQILDHFGARKPILMGTTFAVIAVLLFTIFSRHLTLISILLIYLLYMAGTGFAFGNIMTSGLQNLTMEQQADGNAILTTLQQFAGAMGTSVVAAIIAQSQKQAHVSNAVATANGSHNAFIVLLILAILELLILSKVVINHKEV